MSSQTIIPKSTSLLLDKVDDFYICQGDKYLVKADYSMGDGADITKFILISNLDRILTSTSCINFDEDKLLQKLNTLLIK